MGLWVHPVRTLAVTGAGGPMRTKTLLVFVALVRLRLLPSAGKDRGAGGAAGAEAQEDGGDVAAHAPRLGQEDDYRRVGRGRGLRRLA
eukprot:5137854-Pyramimonas_sp.AAC.1